MPVKTADPSAVELEDAFRAAMEGPAKPREAPPPPVIDREAPHGRNDDGSPKAPYGWTKPQKAGESPRPKLTQGRPGKDDAARTGEVIPPAQPDVNSGQRKLTPAQPADFGDSLSELHDALWFGITGIGMVGSKIPVVGKFIPEKKLAAEGFVWHANKDRLVGTLTLAAKNNSSAARFCAKITQEHVTWVAVAGGMLMPFIVQAAAVARGDEALASFGTPAVLDDAGNVVQEANLPTIEGLAEQNAEAMDAFIASVQAQVQAQQAEANANLNGSAA